MIERKMVDFPQNVSFFLFGPRQTGKTTFLKERLKGQNYFHIDLLLTDLFHRYLKNPEKLRSDILYQHQENKIKIVFIDEIQKVPLLLDEIHWLIENHKISFVLTGSSARKLKRNSSNLLGGRALLRYLFPLTFNELEDKFNLDRVLTLGSLPGVYFDHEDLAAEKLLSYVETYLKEEIIAEAAIRNVGNFHRFMEVAAQHACEQVNYENIAREAAIKSGVIKSYLQILEDTLIGYILPAWNVSVRKRLALHPKFYFFDNGVLNAINRIKASSVIIANYRGKLFEQWIINEIRAFLSYTRSPYKLYFWQTKAGNEVDLVLSQGDQIVFAIEIKAKKSVGSKDFSGLKSISDEYPNAKLILICEEIYPRLEGKIKVLPYQELFKNIGKHLLAEATS